jgi:superfamily II DNA/RNA helicase
MRPEQKSQLLLGVTRSKAKMLEYGVPEEHHIKITQDPARLFTLSIGLLGDLASGINRDENQPEALAELRNNLLFSARFFDSYMQTKLNKELDPYLILLGSASYYLCDLPGSASVLVKGVHGDFPDLGGEGLEDLLLWLLQAKLSPYFEGSDGQFGKLIDLISILVSKYFEDGTGEDNLIFLSTELRDAVYEYGTPRQLLFGELIAAVLKNKIQNSSWKALPLYSGLPRGKWLHALQKESFIKELWPAQHLLGKADVLRGVSAIVQMPTSAGKTKATELVIRSAFLAERTSLVIIVAPFRALCHEIKDSLVAAFRDEPTKVDELSDALQTDFEVADLLGHPQILVVTPEKLVHVLRHAPELADHAGLLVFDEGHQFDSGTRGITYELLLTSLRSMLPEGTQKVLISAVMSNAEAVGEWLNGEPNVVEGTNLNPTFRSVGFASWLDQLGRIEYVESQNAEQGEFFVPRVMESYALPMKPRETKRRVFPEKSDGQAIALYLGLKLVKNGSVAVFCGRKSTATSICEKVVATIARGIPLTLPLEFSDQEEVQRLHNLHVENLGAETSATKSAKHGIFSHHGNTPHGIRLSVEYAMREDLVRFVVCTSTLAQGVNLPIRYLIVTSVYQGLERIKVRDFHNLIGRAGRAGMHTEGSILFADPIVYDKRKAQNEKWRWRQVKELLEPKNSEPCISTLLSIFEPIKSDDGKYTIDMEALDFARRFIRDPDEVSRFADNIARRHGDKGFTRKGVERQVTWRISLISSIESFLLSHWDESVEGLSEPEIIHLAEETLAFFLADKQKRENIIELFKLLAGNISEKITEPARRKVYGRTLYGVNVSKKIEEWVQLNAIQLLSVTKEEELFNLVWPLLTEHIHNGIFKKFDKPDVLKEVFQKWVQGKPFHVILGTIHHRKAKMIWGVRRREFKIDHAVEVCESAFSYDGSLLIGALCEFVEILDLEGKDDLMGQFQIFQKRLKYGLPTATTIALYELGFSDRVISQDLAESLNLSVVQKKDIIKALKKDRETTLKVIEKYPRYFQQRCAELLSN